ncbi:MAG: hypothetical protein HYZ42_14130 [Bacteroidetes bacterium]|nr:hypothetical protein [Bacteroidota bacterium]
MKPSEIIEAIKEFFLDIIGYLIPGTVALSLVLLCVPGTNFDDLLTKVKVEPTIIYLIISYCLGYVVYGVAIVRDKWMDKIKWIETPKKVSENVKNSLQYKIAVETLKSLWIQSNLIAKDKEDIEKFGMTETRGAVMAYIPEVDTKIYTFMFRSELCNHLNVLFLLIFIFGMTSLLINHIFSCILLLKVDRGYIVFYSIALIVSFFLHKTRMRFLRITYNIPFTIFIAKYYRINKKANDAKA